MSYLHPIRLHFAGGFRADVSTVNNNIARFNNAAWEDRFRLPFSGQNDGSNWEPAGTGAWRLLDCKVKRACRVDGSATSDATEDTAVGLALRESGNQSSAKIVDLDPQHQMVSMLFGLVVRLVDSQGLTIMQGDFEPAAFFDLQSKRSSGGGDGGRSAYFQSILKNVEWADGLTSQTLSQMRQASAAGMLSIKLVTDGYHTGGPKRGYGRVAGTIGPYLQGEPRTFVVGRHLAPQQGGAAVDCRVDVERRKVFVDVGNSLPVDTATGDFSDSGELTLVAGSGETASIVGALDYRGACNYSRTAGIYELPAGRALTDAELAAATQRPLQLITQPQGAAAPSVLASENDDGFYVRAEQFVFRLDPGASATADLIVTKFGNLVPGARPQITVEPFSLRETSPLPNVTVVATSAANGRAAFTITAVDPGTPRNFIDGQVYAIQFSLADSATDPTDFYRLNFISLLMFSGAKPAPAVLGWDDVWPIFKQYAHLYPRPHGPESYAPFDGSPPSHPVVNLDDYDSVAGFARHIVRALALPIEHPNHMPVTRDLSRAKRALLLKWLREVGADGKPRRIGTPAPAALAETTAPAVAASQRFAAKNFVTDPELFRHKSA